MEINGLTLPTSFIQAIAQNELKKRVSSWEASHLQNDLDAYGESLETELNVFYEDLAILQKETDSLSKDFPPLPDDFEEMEENQPGYVPYINDFSEIVCFGMAFGAEPFCFDFREKREEPSVIWWQDSYWRRIAPNFESFLNLFHPL